MNILMICYYYPPVLDVGSKRSIAFSIYFKQHGWTPYVISVRNPDKHYCTVGKDTPPNGVVTEYTFSLFNIYHVLGRIHGALAKLLKLAKIKLRRNFLRDLFCIPDHFLGWIPLTLIKGIKSIKEHNIDVVYVSCSPFSSAIIGILLKKITGKPLVIDFRDPFAIDGLPSRMDMPSWRAKLNVAIENRIIKAADIFIVTSEEVKNVCLDQYPVSRGKTFVVPNGFDGRYLASEELAKFEKFTIIYAGQFYLYDKRNDIYTDAFLGGMAKLKSKSVISRKNFQFLYFGDGRDLIHDLAKKYFVSDLVICGDRKPYVDILQDIKRSHLQLLRIAKPMISTKLFEGIALNIPFLATIPGGEVESIINEYSPGSYVITERSQDAVAEAIIDARKKYQDGQIQLNKITDFTENYSREKLSLKLMEIIEKNIL